MQARSTDKSLIPFSCTYSPHVPELLLKLGCSLAVSTYQAGKVLFLSPVDEDKLVQLPRTFAKPMGLTWDATRDMLALAARDSILTFRNSVELASYYPRSPDTYDALYLPRVTYHTGALDIHDLRFGANGNLYAVNTLFSCIAAIDDQFNFTPLWTPPFIDAHASEDRCHLNGMAMAEGKPKYVTMFGEGNSPRSWTSTLTESGVIYDVDTNDRVIGGLGMPHSPRIIDGKLYTLLSATGELVQVDIQSSKYISILNAGGFVRGLAYYRDYVFIGLSKLRKNSSSFGKLDIADKSRNAGIVIAHLPTGSIAGQIIYNSSVDEIYDLLVLPNIRRPNILNTSTDDHKLALMTPTSTYWARPRDENGDLNE